MTTSIFLIKIINNNYKNRVNEGFGLAIIGFLSYIIHMRNWTSEERAKQAAAIRRWKPWENSTGPRTEEGKEKCGMNALKHGFHDATMRKLRVLLRRQRDYVKRCMEGAPPLPRPPNISKQTIKKPSGPCIHIAPSPLGGEGRQWQ